MNRIRHLLLFAAVLMHSGLAVSAFPGRPSPQRLVNDLAGLFSASQTESLESRLVAFDDSTSNQITVVTVSDLEGYEPAQFAVKLGEEWGVGTRERDNGIIVLVKPKTASGDGRVTIQVGYGLEGAIPDAYCTRIIRNTMIPHFRNNDYFQGVQAACEELMGLASGEISEPRGGEEEEGSFASILFIFILFIVLMIVFSKGSGKGSGHNGPGGGRHLYMGPVGRAASLGGLMGGLSGGFSGGSRGGFSGGFGGFGGGSFGGGGASGSW